MAAASGCPWESRTVPSSVAESWAPAAAAVRAHKTKWMRAMWGRMASCRPIVNRRWARLPQLVQHLPRLRVVRMLLQQFHQDRPRLLLRALQAVYSSQIQVRLVEAGSHSDAFLELADGFVPPPGSQIKYAEVVQRFGIARPKPQGLLQITIGALRIVRLREYHGQVVIRLRVLRPRGERALQRLPGVVPALLQTVGVPQIFQGDPVIGTYFQRFLKMADRVVRVSVARGQQAQVVPRVGHRIGIAGV